ncbi:MAG: 3-hydroxyanthranilic acid dioxygenase [Pycnora praestabilis]|nr:MAG: 3-hydroxyanthranilic acid dioxygenase [Pycnora praestabilis]
MQTLKVSSFAARSSICPPPPQRRPASSSSGPLSLAGWLEENSHLLKPPINNYCVYNKDVTVMIVGGPNARTDYHINETAEWFYQYKGSMLLKVIENDSSFRDIHIHEGCMFLLPPHTPHNPVRYAHTVGIVLEQPRPAESLDRLRWYCQDCREVVHEEAFHCTDLGSQIKEAVNAFRDDREKRTCGKCGALADVVPKKQEDRGGVEMVEGVH